MAYTLLFAFELAFYPNLEAYFLLHLDLLVVVRFSMDYLFYEEVQKY